MCSSSNHTHGVRQLLIRRDRYTSEYRWLTVSYLILIAYVYTSASKVSMVKSKSGLTFAIVFSVLGTLVVTYGLSWHLRLQPMTNAYATQLCPYLAMILGVENTLAITRSVVATPVAWSVRARLAHGLGREGFSVTCNFLLELLCALCGYAFSNVAEAQEFFAFVCIGLVVDFYMQLFFYAPCLTMDLLRLDSSERQRLEMLQWRQCNV